MQPNQTQELPIQRPIIEVKGRSLSLAQLLDIMRAQGTSDLYLKIGSPIRLKIDGRVIAGESPPISRRQMDYIVGCFLTEEQRRVFHRRLVADVVHIQNNARYRLHFGFGHTGPYATVRAIGQEIMPFDKLGHPHRVAKWLTTIKSGLLILCGSTDAGKTVTCASLLENINQTQQKAILTLEDPIEYIFEDRHSLVLQREVGLHVPSFAAGVRSALRENLDVIFVGEMREIDTMEQVLRAGETGHLVVTTVHSDDALSAINRIIGTFPTADQPRIRQSLAATITGVVYQRLLPRRGGGRVPCVETLWANTAVRTILRSGDLSKLGSYVGRATGGISYRECLVDLRSFDHIEADVLAQEQARMAAGQ
jgi:twitching motility protein PilT